MQYHIVIILLVFSTFSVNGQGPVLDWATKITSMDTSPIASVTDNLGNLYITGTFATDTDMDNGPDVVELVCEGQYDVYISKFDANGNLIWAERIGGIFNDYPSDISVDENGYVYVIGQCWTEGFYGSAIDSNWLVTEEGPNAFTLKIDNNGNLEWMKSISAAIRPLSIDINNDGDIYTTGSFAYDVDFDPGALEANDTSSTSNLYIQKLDELGNFQWVKTFKGENYIYGNTIRCDSENNIVIVGSYRETVDFDPGEDTVYLSMAAETYSSTFVLKLDENGNFIWIYSTNEGVSVERNHMVLDSQDNIIVTGVFKGVVDFDYNGYYPLASGFGIVPSSYSYSGFLLKIDKNGNFQWVHNVHAPNSSQDGRIATDILNGVYYTSFYKNTVDLNPTLGITNCTSVGWDDPFILKFDGDGTFVWVSTYGGTWSERSHDIVSSIDGSLYVVGRFRYPCDFDPSANEFYLDPGPGNGTTYIQKFNSTLEVSSEFIKTSPGLFPNPASDIIRIKLESDQFEVVSIVNAIGKVQEVQVVNDEINISMLSNGIYFVRISDSHSNQHVLRFVKQ